MRTFSKCIPLFLLAFLLLLPFSKASVDTTYQTRLLSDNNWHQLTSDKAFNYKNDREEELPPPSPPAENKWYKYIGNIIAFFSSGIGKFIFWGALILVFLFSVYKIFFSESFSPFAKTKRTNSDSSQIVDDINLVDWEEKLHQARQANDLRLAVRYSYMWLLQILQSRELIQYRNDKTNYDYYNELSETDFKQPFKQLSRQYEYAWYGHFDLSDQNYDTYMQLFNNVKNQLS